MNLNGLENLASSVIPILAIVLIIGLGILIKKGRIAEFAGIVACALLAAAAVTAIINWERVGPAILSLVGL